MKLIGKFFRLEKFEKKHIFIISLFLIGISIIPVLAGYFFTPIGSKYIGLRSLAAGDLSVYFSYINQIKSGDWVLYNFFTSESQTIGMFNIWWLIVGLGAKLFNLSPGLALVFSRLLLIPVLVWIFYKFCSYFLQNRWQRLGALWVGFFSGGLGFWTILLSSSAGEIAKVGERYNWPIDLWITEATLFNAVFFSPLVIASLIFTMAILLLMIISFDQKKNKYALLAGGLTLAYLNFHPYYWPVIIAVPLIFSLTESFIAKKINWQMFSATAILFFVSLPSVLYHFWLIRTEEAIALRALQNVTPMVSPIYLLLGYGFLWLGLFLGIYFLYQQKNINNKFRYLIIWLLVLLALSYGPFPFQSRYTQGMQIPLIILTVVGLWYLGQALRQKVSKSFYEIFIINRYLLGIMFVLVFSFSVLLNFSRDVYYLVNPYDSQVVMENYYIDQDFYQVINYLENLPRGSANVLSGINQGKTIAAFSLQKSFISHPHETIFFKSKSLALDWFYSLNTSNNARKDFLVHNNIDYVLEDKKNDDLSLSEADFLLPVIKTDSLVLYQVIR